MSASSSSSPMRREGPGVEIHEHARRFRRARRRDGRVRVVSVEVQYFRTADHLKRNLIAFQEIEVVFGPGDAASAVRRDPAAGDRAAAAPADPDGGGVYLFRREIRENQPSVHIVADARDEGGGEPEPRRADRGIPGRTSALNPVFGHLDFAVARNLRNPAQMIVAAIAQRDKFRGVHGGSSSRVYWNFNVQYSQPRLLCQELK